jgi:hypothetical protein
LGRDTVEAHLVATCAMGLDPSDLVQRLRDRVQYRAVVAMTDTKQNALLVKNWHDWVDVRVTVLIRKLHEEMNARHDTPEKRAIVWEALAHRCLALVAEARKEMEEKR